MMVIQNAPAEPPGLHPERGVDLACGGHCVALRDRVEHARIQVMAAAHRQDPITLDPDLGSGWDASAMGTAGDGDDSFRARLADAGRPPTGDGARARASPGHAEGELVGARFRIEKLLGTGGFAHVYLAWDETLGRRVALKVLARGETTAEQRAALVHEGRALGRVRDQHVAQVFDIEIAGDEVLLVIEAVEGASLLHRTDLGSADRLRIAADVARGIAAVHRNGVVHRDLKPSNIIVTPDKRAKVVDFGVAKLPGVDAVPLPPASGERAPGSLATERGLVVGTPDYMAPEQRKGSSATARTDVYAFGVVLDRDLFDPLSRAALDRRTADAIAACVVRCTRERPEDRPDAEELCRELDDLVERATIPDASHGRVEAHPSRRSAPRVARRVAALSAGVLAVGSVAWGVHHAGGAPSTIARPAASSATPSEAIGLPDDSVADDVVSKAAGIAVHEKSPSADLAPTLGPPMLSWNALREHSVRAWNLEGTDLVPAVADPIFSPRMLHHLTTRVSRGTAGGLTLTDVESGLSVRAYPGEQTSGSALVARGYAVQENWQRGMPIVHAVRADAVDELLLVATPAPRELSITVELLSGVAAVRSMGGALEFIDSAGAPRLRMAHVEAIDAEGGRHAVPVVPSGCLFDTDTRPPWGRDLPDAASRSCVVTLRLPPEGLPPLSAVVWSWQATGSHAIRRVGHTTTPIPGDRAVVIGGFDSLAHASVEMFDAGTQSWAFIGSLIEGRFWHSAALLADGRVLVAGGSAPSAEILDPSTGRFQKTERLPCPRYDATATTLPDGRVLVVGGGCCDGCCSVHPSNTAFVYSPRQGRWSPPIPLRQPRKRHTATLLSDGKVLVVGSQVPGDPQGSSEVFDPDRVTFETSGALLDPRSDQAAVRLPDGRVLVVAGVFDGGGLTRLRESAELWNEASGQWSRAPTPPFRTGFMPILLPLRDGRALLTGGDELAGWSQEHPLSFFDPASGTWTAPSERRVAGERLRETAAELDDGTILLTGRVPNEIVSPSGL